MRDLLRLAAARGLTVHATHMPAGELGYYEHHRDRIWFDIGLTYCERRVVIAHELGHWQYSDECGDDGGPLERRADAYAASLLIDPLEYARLEIIDPDIEYLADAFRVTTECIVDFQRYCLRPIGRSVYLKLPQTRERRIA